MISRTMIGRLLIIGPVGGMASWLIWGGMLGVSDFGDHAAMVAAISANADITKWIMGLAIFFFLLLVAGLTGLRNTMTGGPGSDYAAMGVLFVVMAMSVGLAEVALTMGAAEIGASGNGSLAMTMYLAGNAIGAISTAAMMLGMAVLGLGIYMQKNFHVAIAGLLMVGGIAGLSISLYDYGNQLLTIGYLGMSIGVASIGVSIVRSSD